LTKFLQLYSSIAVVLAVLLFSLGACTKYEGSQTVPAYLKIDTVFFATNYGLQGENSHEITDVWIYVDDQQIGVFEIPALFPVLAMGKHKLEIRPGIKVNGISSTRAPYPLMKPRVFDNFDFYPDSVQELNNLTFKYYNNSKFAWLEDFESFSITIESLSYSDTAIKRTEPANNPEAYLSSTSKYSGIINLTEEREVYGAWSIGAFELPILEAPVLLEMDFKTDNYVSVGLLVYLPGDYERKPLVVLNHSEEWNHIYINLTPTVNQFPNAINFKVLFEAAYENGNGVSNIYLDNIKLIYRDNQ